MWPPPTKPRMRYVGFVPGIGHLLWRVSGLGFTYWSRAPDIAYNSWKHSVKQQAELNRINAARIRARHKAEKVSDD